MLPGRTFATAVEHHRAGRLREAESLYRQILQTDPNHADSLHMLGLVALQTGRYTEAIELITRAIGRAAQVPGFHNNLGNAYMAVGRWADAESAFRRARDLKSDYGEAHYNLGNALSSQDKTEEAAAAYRQAIAVRPNHAESWLNLSNALQVQGRLEEATEACQRAITLKPQLTAAHNNLGNLLMSQNRFEAALAAYSRTLELKPDLASAHYNRGLALLHAGHAAEAITSCRQALAVQAGFVPAHLTLGHALIQTGDTAEALRYYQRALEIDPNRAEAKLGAAIATIPIICRDSAQSSSTLGHFGRELEELARWATAHPGALGDSVGKIQPFYLAYRPADVTSVLSRYGDLASAQAAAYWKPPAEAGRKIQPRRDRIRVAIVSGQVRRHPVWEVILRGCIAHLDPTQFEVFVYHTSPVADEETAWARTRVARFIQGPRSTAAWLAHLRDDRPDVIFYPEVGMDPPTCALAALRLAPLQLAGWGHPVTTGLPMIDGFVSGELLEGPQADQHYREKLIRLPGTGVHTEFSAAAPQPWGGPDRRPGVVRFALCHQPIKFDPEDDRLLARIAKEVGPCEFWLAAPANMPWTARRLRERLTTVFRSEGLDSEVHLREMPWLTRERFLGYLDEMDICLDCPAFSGYTTAWQALHRGLPLVTLEGQFLRQRLAAGLLRQAGVPDGITLSREQYLAKAIEWAQEARAPGLCSARRAELRQAAARADGNRGAILGFEQALREAI